MEKPWWLWVAFNAFVLAMMALDLGVFHRKSHEVKFKEAMTWTGVWVALALTFNALIFWKWSEFSPGSSYTNSQAAMAFLTGYLVEKALSVDNIFVFIMVFAYFHVPLAYQHKVLFWGIVGALVMRAICIFAGISLLHRFHWLIYVFGAFLIITGIKMVLQKDKQIEPDKNPVLRFVQRIMHSSPNFDGDKFFTTLVDKKGIARRAATPLFITLVFIELTDLMFAVDSIPAILAITQDPFIVYTSNVFAILGLRSLYFALAGIMSLFHYLHYGLSAILVFVGSKMLLVDVFHIPVAVSLSVVVGILALSVFASMMFPKSEAEVLPAPIAPDDLK